MSSVGRTQKGSASHQMRAWLTRATAPPTEHTLSLVPTHSPTLPPSPRRCCPCALELSGWEPPHPPRRGEAGRVLLRGGRTRAAGPKGTSHAALCPGLATAEGHQPVLVGSLLIPGRSLPQGHSLAASVTLGAERLSVWSFLAVSASLGALCSSLAPAAGVPLPLQWPNDRAQHDSRTPS